LIQSLILITTRTTIKTKSIEKVSMPRGV